MCDGSQCLLCLPIHFFSLSTLNQQYYLRWNVWIFGYKNCVNLFTGETVNVYTWQTMCITDFAMYEKIKPMTEECLRLLQRTCEKRAPCLLKIEHMPRWFGTADGTPSDCCLHDVKAVPKHLQITRNYNGQWMEHACQQSTSAAILQAALSGCLLSTGW